MGQIAQMGQGRGRHRRVDRKRRRGRGRVPLPERRGQVPRIRIRGRPCRRRPRGFRACGQSRLACRPAIATPGRHAPGCGACQVPRRSRSKKPPRFPMLQRCSISEGSQAIKRSLKPGNSSDGESFNDSQIDPGFEDGKVGPDVRAAKKPDSPEFHILSSHCRVGCGDEAEVSQDWDSQMFAPAEGIPPPR